jgi:pilus assembly protein CpaB
MQNIEVLTAGQRIEPDPKGKPETVNVVTMLLTPEDAEKLVMAYSQGSVQYVLRNGADKLTTETRPVFAAELFSGVKKAAAVRRVAGGPRIVRPKAPEFYVVETIAGNHRSTEKFVEKNKLQ